MAVYTVGKEFLNSSHGDFVYFDEMFFEFFFIDLWSLGIYGLEVLLKDFEAIAFGDVDFDNLFSEFKTAHLVFVGMG